MSLALQPISYREAMAFIDKHHRHHKRPRGWLFGHRRQRRHVC